MTEKERFFNNLEQTYAKCLDTARKKNADYAGDANPFKNFELVEELGICSVETGILVRLCDKFSRLNNLIGSGREAQVKDESVEDTIQDAINYLAILKAYRQRYE